MDHIQSIAISQIADVLSKGKLINPIVDIWKKIFYNSGQSELFDDNTIKLKIICVDDWNKIYQHNDRCYSALQEILLDLLDEFDAFTKVINSIVSKINIYNVFIERIDRDLKKGSSHFDLVEYLKKQEIEKNINLLDNYPSKDFKCLRSNLNILGLDITFDKEEKNELVVMPFSFVGNTTDKTIIVRQIKRLLYDR